MRKPASDSLTADVANEVSARDGMIDYVATGRIDKLGNRHQLTLRLFDGESRTLLASNDLSTDSPDDLIALAERQAAWLLDHLHAPVAPRGNHPERVTTGSLEALKLYTQGFSQYQGYPMPVALPRNELAAQYFQEAVRIDPEFASAHLMLAWTYRMIDGTKRGPDPSPRAFDALDRALET